MEALARVLSAGRIAIGLAFMLRPSNSIRGWVGERTASSGGGRLLTQALGARDVALGAGALQALASGAGDARPWFVAQALSDGTDFAATLGADGLRASSRVFGMLMAGGSTLISVAYLASRDPTKPA